MWFIMIKNHLKADYVQPKTPLFTSDSQHPPRFRHAVYLGAAVILVKIIFSEPNSFMHMFNVSTLYRKSIKLFHQKLW